MEKFRYSMQNILNVKEKMEAQEKLLFLPGEQGAFRAAPADEKARRALVEIPVHQADQRIRRGGKAGPRRFC